MKHPGRWIWLLLAIPVIIGFTRLRFDVEVLNLLPGDSRVVQGLKIYQEHFADARELIITIRASEAEGAEHAARQIAGRLREETNLVASVFWQPPWLEHPGQAAELIAATWLNRPPSEFGAFVSGLSLEKIPEKLAAAREDLATSMSPQEIARLGYDPLGFTRLPESVQPAQGMSFGQGQEMFASEDGRFRVVFVRAASELSTYRQCADWLEQVRSVVDSVMVSTGTTSVSRVGYTGRPAFVAEIAGGMESDMSLSVVGTAVVIGILFWIAHRRWKPMLWLLTLLALVLGATLGLGGLFYGAINVVSMGFAAILLGLAVDYAVVHYQEALAHPHLSIPDIRRAIAPSITWAAVTTIAAFISLNFGGLPGLSQLGTLVALGVFIAALVMIFEYLPPLFPERRESASAPAAAIATPPAEDSRLQSQAAMALTWVLVLGCAGVLVFGLPRMNPTADPLRPRNSAAYAALDEVKKLLGSEREPLWLIIGGASETEVADRLKAAAQRLELARSNQVISGFTLPTALWPEPEFQKANLALVGDILKNREALRKLTLDNGFRAEAFGLADAVLNSWQEAAGGDGVYWPTNELSAWVVDRFAARRGNGFFALGLITPETKGRAGDAALASLEADLSRDRMWLSGWELLGEAVFTRVRDRFWMILLPIAGLVLASLWMAFRRWREVLLSVGVLTLSGVCLLSLMKLTGWSWNLLNLMAVPLVLGTGVDYSIFMQLALRRHGGNRQIAYRSVGRALLLCGGTAVAGFGALAFSSNAGMASLGAVCAAGIALNMLVSIVLLPSWWQRVGGRGSAPIKEPSSLYRAPMWRLGWWLVSVLPLGVCHGMARNLARAYWIFAAHRRAIVEANLAPVVGCDRRAARRAGRELFEMFGVKLVDLWRYETGHDIQDLFGESTGWDFFTKAVREKRGVLLLTPHLGNWEFGAAWLQKGGVSLQVITLAEPGADLTRLRQESRRQRKIETLVIGTDPFGFVEVIRRLESGATVALLVDRPPAATAVTVELFGKPFEASIAAAELARASGCVLLPVFLPLEGSSYGAHMLPPVEYDRAELRDREKRKALAQKIMKAFEPVIRKYPQQWYHFVPIWPERKESEQTSRRNV